MPSALLLRRWPGVLFVQDPSLRFQFVNPRIEEWTGIRPSDWRIQEDLFWRVIHGSDRGRVEAHLKRSVERQGGSTAVFRLRHVHTGRITWVRETREAVLARDGQWIGYEGLWQDVTREVTAERRLMELSWMATTGVLTASVAHDLNNFLAGVHALSETFQSQLDDNNPVREGLRIIQANSQNASASMRRIVSLYRDRGGEPSFGDLNELLKETIQFVQKAVSRRFVVEAALESVPMPVYVDPVELRKVFVNLVFNAVDATPGRGRITIRTFRLAKAPWPVTVDGGLPDRPCFGLCVKDEGVGIRAGHMERLFDPGFTTRPGNQGFGLGLCGARAFAEKHRGAISVDSTEGGGSTFTLWLPEADFTEPDRGPAGSHDSSHTVLLAGDSGCRDELAAALRREGLYVATPAPGQDVPELLGSGEYEFSAVIILASNRASAPEPLFRMLRERKVPVRTVLVAGPDPDDAPVPPPSYADLTFPFDGMISDLVGRITALLGNQGRNCA